MSSQVMGCPFSASDSFRLMLSPAHSGPGSTSRDSSGFWYLTSPCPASIEAFAAYELLPALSPI